MLYLSQTVDGAAMVGAIDADAVMTPRLTLSYRTAEAPAASLLAPAGYVATGHEFHRTTVAPALDREHPGWLLDGTPAGFSLDPGGRGERTLHASYLHTHWAGHPLLAARFAAAVHRAAATGVVAAKTAQRAQSTAAKPEYGRGPATAGRQPMSTCTTTATPRWKAT